MAYHRKMKLQEALDRMREIASARLVIATDRKDVWSIRHYKNDLLIIDAQLQ